MCLGTAVLRFGIGIGAKVVQFVEVVLLQFKILELGSQTHPWVAFMFVFPIRGCVWELQKLALVLELEHYNWGSQTHPWLLISSVVLVYNLISLNNLAIGFQLAKAKLSLMGFTLAV